MKNTTIELDKIVSVTKYKKFFKNSYILEIVDVNNKVHKLEYTTENHCLENYEKIKQKLKDYISF